MEAWYAIYTKPNAEAQVARTLIERGFVTYLPLLPARPDSRARPLFPTYLFVRCDLSQVIVDRLQWIPGLHRILEFGGRPAVVPDAAVALIQDAMRDIEAAGGLPPHPFKPGDHVVIEEGPLAGLRGVFEGPLKPAERVRILIHFLGETNRAEVPADSLRKADTDEVRIRRRGTRGRGRWIRYDGRG